MPFWMILLSVLSSLCLLTICARNLIYLSRGGEPTQDRDQAMVWSCFWPVMLFPVLIMETGIGDFLGPVVRVLAQLLLMTILAAILFGIGWFTMEVGLWFVSQRAEKRARQI